MDEDQLLLKWEDRGTVWGINRKEGSKDVEVVVCDVWNYPKVRPISKKHIALLKHRVQDRFAQEGSHVSFVTLEEEK